MSATALWPGYTMPPNVRWLLEDFSVAVKRPRVETWRRPRRVLH